MWPFFTSYVCSCYIALVVSNSVWPARLLCPWDFPDKNTGVSCHILLHGMFLTQGLNLCLLCLLHWQEGSLPRENTFQIYLWLSVVCLHCFKNVLSSNDFQFEYLIHSAICNDSWTQICPHWSEHKECILGKSLVVQWLGLCAFTAEGQGSTSGRGIKILQALWWSQRKPPNNTFLILAYKALHVYLVLHPSPSSTSFMTQFPGSPRDTGFPHGSDSKESACNAGDAGDMGQIPGLGRFLGVGNGNSLQYSCLENPMDRGAWWTIIHRVAKSQTRLNTHTRDTRSLLGLCTCSSPCGPTFPSGPVTQLEKKLASTWWFWGVLGLSSRHLGRQK